MKKGPTKLDLRQLLKSGEFARLGSQPHWRKVENELGITTNSGGRVLFDGLEFKFSKTQLLERIYSTRFAGPEGAVDWMGLGLGMTRFAVEDLLAANGVGFEPFENDFPLETLDRIMTEGGVQLGFHEGELYDLLKIYIVEKPKKTISFQVSEEVYQSLRKLSEESRRSMGQIVAGWTRERLESMND